MIWLLWAQHQVTILLHSTLPHSDQAWLTLFVEGLRQLSDRAGVRLIGGDTTKGSLSITIQVHGWIEYGKELRRSNANVGELLYVSGTLGDAGAGLKCAKGLINGGSESERAYLLSRFYEPEPRLELGQSITNIASSCIDISDGLLADAKHIANASGLGIELDVSAIPLSDALLSCCSDTALELALGAGDDYELLFYRS